MSSSQTVTYTRLRDGSWGLRGPGLVAGNTVIVTRRSGAPKTEVVGKVLWSGDGVSLATIHGSESRATEARGRCGRRPYPSAYSEGGGMYRGGQSYIDSRGQFVLGDDD